MKRHVFDSMGVELLRTEEATPIHAEDFCDSCGDCLDCHYGEPCVHNKHGHFWVVYVPAPLPGDQNNG